MPNLSGPTLIVILFIVLLLFGAPKLPALAKSLGQSMKILKKEVSTDQDEGQKDAKAAEAVDAAPALSEADQAKEELAKARAEAAAAKAEAEALRQQAAAASETPRAD